MIRFTAEQRLPAEGDLRFSLYSIFRDIARALGDAGTRNVESVTSTAPDRTWVGKCRETSTGFTVPANMFIDGDVFSIDVTGGTPITITQGSGLTLRLAGTATTGNRTIAGYGLATVKFVSPTDCKIAGAGVT